MEKRGAAEAKLQAAEQKKLDLIGKAQDKPRKALIRELRKSETFKQLKTKIAEAEKAARKAAADAKKLAAAEAKANKPTKVTKAWAKLFDKSVKKVEVDAKKVATQLKALVTLKKKAVAKAAKEAVAQAKKDAAEAKKKAAAKPKPTKVDAAMIKRWNKVLTKGIKRGETDTKKALAQLKQLKTKKVQADAKAAKEAAKAAKKAEPKAKKTKKKAVEEAAVGDDLIATLLAKANETGPEPAVAKPAAELAPEPAAELAPEPAAELAPEPVEEEEDVAVVRFEHDGVKYLKDNEGYLYDPETQEEVGFWNGSEVEELEDM
jgi:colicin import membrane protein